MSYRNTKVLVMVSTPGPASRRRQLPRVPAGRGWHNTAASATPCATLREPPPPPPPRTVTVRAARHGPLRGRPHSRVPIEEPAHAGPQCRRSHPLTAGSTRPGWSGLPLPGCTAQDAHNTGGSCHDWKAPVLHLCLRVPHHCGISRQTAHI